MVEEDAPETNALSESIGERIKVLRRRRGLSQENLAMRHRVQSSKMGLGIKMTRIMVASTEAGDRHIKADELPAFCAALEVPLEELLGGASPTARRAMFPKAGEALDYATLADPERLTHFLLQQLQPSISRMVEQIAVSTVERQAPDIVRQALREVVGGA